MRLPIQTWHLSGLAALAILGIFCAFNTISGRTTDSFTTDKQNILLRNIGHEVLLHAGDSTSRVLPIERITDNEYLIQFENEFTFQPDSLVKIIRNSLAKAEMPRDYIVNVLSCSTKDVIFGYAILGTTKNNIVPCLSRNQPKSCYLINLKFQRIATEIIPQFSMWVAISLATLVALGILYKQKYSIKFPASNSSISTTSMQEENMQADSIQIGNTIFDPKKKRLLTGEVHTDLTTKESKILTLFALQPNQVIERSQLQKQIWEDEGVIVGRSLDVFISKLRKKLEQDPSLQLVNIHGKGYKLKNLL